MRQSEEVRTDVPSWRIRFQPLPVTLPVVFFCRTAARRKSPVAVPSGLPTLIELVDPRGRAGGVELGRPGTPTRGLGEGGDGDAAFHQPELEGADTVVVSEKLKAPF